MENAYNLITSMLKYASYKNSSNPIKSIYYSMLNKRTKKKLSQHFFSNNKTLVEFFMEIVDLHDMCYSNLFRPFIKSKNGFTRLVGESNISLVFDHRAHVIVDTSEYDNIVKTVISWNKKELSFETTSSSGVISRFSIVGDDSNITSDYKLAVVKRLRSIFVDISYAIIDSISIES